MQITSQNSQRAADLHWLAFLLTGRRELSVDLAIEAMTSDDMASPYFSTWMQAWSRRVVIAKALAAVRHELTSSAYRTKSKSAIRQGLPDREWTLDQATTKVELETALLAIDVFPRAALLLSIFEGMPIDDAAVLLDVTPALFRKAQTVGLGELTGNLARMQGWVSPAANASIVGTEAQYA